MATVHQCDMCPAPMDASKQTGGTAIYKPLSGELLALDARIKAGDEPQVEEYQQDPQKLMKLMMAMKAALTPARKFDLCASCSQAVVEFIESSRTMMAGVKSGEVRVN